MYSKVYCSTVYNSQDMEITQMSTGRGKDKEDVVYLYLSIYIHTLKYYSTINRNETGSFVKV